MTNRILDLVVLDHRLDPVETEVRIHVKVEHLTPTTEIRGRLAGPRCVYASTIEIAYPLREISRTEHIELRVLIPEPSWWEPQTPFLYEGAIELWQDGASCERVPVRHGIRRLQLTSKGLRLNGKPFTLRGKVAGSVLTEAEAKKLRENEIDTLLTNVAEPDLALWDMADRYGFFVLGTAVEPAPFVQCRHELAAHPSALGWIFNRDAFMAGPSDEKDRDVFYGVNTSALNSPPNTDFLVCHENELAWLDAAELPKIVVTKKLPNPLPARADVIGWIEAPTT